jgi:predicted metal-dependent hydrolase
VSAPAGGPPSLALRIRRSERARRTRVSVDASGAVEVVLPSTLPDRAADEAVRELRPWIEARRRSLTDARAELARPAGTVPYLDQALRVTPEAGRRRAERRGDALLVPAIHGAAAIEAFYRESARIEVASRLDAACARAGTAYTRLSIREQRTRWASCSSSGAMSFNWRLMLAPAAVIDYVVEHEVCHLEVRDHSRRFWALLESRLPGWREQARWLKRYGPLLADDSALRSAS